MSTTATPRVLCLAFEGLEEIETITPLDVLRRAGVEVVFASITSSIHITGRSRITFHADTTLESVDPSTFDLLLIPGGPGVQGLRQDGTAAALARQFIEQGKPVAAICAAPLVLNDGGLLEGRAFTSFPGTQAELPARIPDQRVVCDGLLITSQGAGTAMEFSLALVERLCSKEKSFEIAASIVA